MNKINTDSWREYVLEDLFDIVKSKAYHRRSVIEVDDNYEDSINYVTRSKFNNGVLYRVKKDDSFQINPKGTISIGAENVDFFLQKEEYITGNSMSYIDTHELTTAQSLYIKTILQKTFKERYNYSDALTGERLKKETILLPTKNNQPDWEYMETYITQKQEEAKEKLQQLQSIPEKRHEIDISGWEEYDVDELFELITTKKKVGRKDISDTGRTPVYSSDTQNNGLRGYTNKDADIIIKSDYYIIFGDHTRAFNYVFEDFCITDNVKVLIPKHCQGNINVTNFILTVWLNLIPNLGYSRHWSVARDVKIPLPTKNNQPDWEYMENYITRKQAEVQEKLRGLRDE